MKTPDETNIESMLQATIRNPSPRFEAALRAIPGRAERESRLTWLAALKPLALAASILLALGLFMVRQSGPGPAAPMAAATPALDGEWVELFSLASALEDAVALSDDEILPALEYYAFNP
jgi:hypothetical protein